MSDQAGVVNIKGKDYKTVAFRIQRFMEKYPEHRFFCELISADELRVVMKATVVDPDGKEVSRGWAEEVRSASNINQTSALENCETSAIGRALAFFDVELMGSAIASADEVANAIGQQGAMQYAEEMNRYQEVVRQNFHSIDLIKRMLADQAWSTAAEAEAEIPRDDLVVLWRAPTKGGIWTTQERTLLKSPEMSEARKFYATSNGSEE